MPAWGVLQREKTRVGRKKKTNRKDLEEMSKIMFFENSA